MADAAATLPLARQSALKTAVSATLIQRCRDPRTAIDAARETCRPSMTSRIEPPLLAVP
jgi:hypothetical protein